LRSLLRQDPEVIMVGEIRDQETAKTAIEAALTGHLVISTLHAGSSCGVIGRLLEMGIEPYLLTSALKGIMNQRLVRRLCPACRSVRGPEAVVDPGAELESRGPPHCPECLGTGYRGRLLLAELLVLDDGLRRAIVAKSDTNTLETIAAPTLRRDIRAAADQAVYAGLTSSQEIDRVLGHRMT
jgi:type II secretory ATPase GspE/PulE/Tfp pilus assembly ATPase PilB-like protein